LYIPEKSKFDPDENGHFGIFGGRYVPETLMPALLELKETYEELRHSEKFWKEVDYYLKDYVGRPSPLYYAANLSEELDAKIYIKREDLNHTGAHKLNHCMGEALLAKEMGKTKIIAETGAGQHGVALATAAAYFGLECEIHMGEIDIEKEHPNVTRMQILGAKLVPVSFGARTLKEAVDSAFGAYMQDPVSQMYAIGSVVGPHPFPQMVRDFQSVVGIEAREQFFEMTGGIPDHAVACVGGGSNAMGLFSGFLDDYTKLYAVEPLGKSTKLGEHAASLSFGSEGVMHGFNSIMLKDDKGEPAPVHSIASGLDYPSVGPEHAHLNDIERTIIATATDEETIDAFYTLSRLEGIIPALESAHAVAYTMKLAEGKKGETILINLSGRGDKDLDYVAQKFPRA
jgi:tryptophan synthase beta chain